MTTKQPPRITVETQRKCANPGCEVRVSKSSKYKTCSVTCFQAVKAEQERVEAQDKLPVEDPF